MNESCADCPWWNEQKKQCLRTPPRFCSMDESEPARPALKAAVTAPKQAEPATKIHRAA